MEEENDIVEKQEYLRINILEKGYNGEEFMNYLQTLKGDEGLQIENWPKNDLIKAVQDYIKINPKNEDNNQINDENNQNNDNDNNNQNNGNDIDDKNLYENINNNKANNNPIQNRENIPCKKAEVNEISVKDNLIITLSSPEMQGGGLFSKAYVTYLVETKPLGFKVRRRFSDFIWLHDILKSLYINCVIPPIIKKNYIMGIDVEGINKRIRVVEKFLQEISVHPLLGRSEIFYDFISLRNDKDFSIKKASYSKITPPTKVEEIKTLDGEVNICINKEKELVAAKINNIAETNIDLMKKITKEYKLLNLQIKSIIDKMKSISSIWVQLYNKSNKNFEGEIISGTYDSLNKFMEDWAKLLQSQKDQINYKIREYFRYIKNEYQAIKDYYNLYEETKNNYKKSYQKLNEKKEKLFNEKKIDDWGLDREDLENKVLLFKEKELSMAKMLPEETKKIKDKKKMYGCYLNTLIDEYEKVKTLNSKRHKINVLSFIKSMSNIIINFHVSLNGIIGYIDTMKEDLFN